MVLWQLLVFGVTLFQTLGPKSTVPSISGDLHCFSLILLPLDVSAEQLVGAQEEWLALLSLVGVILHLWKQGNAAPSLPRGCSTVQAVGTTHTVSITNGIPRQ